MKIIFAFAALVSAAYALDTADIVCLEDGKGISIQLKESDFPAYSGADRAKLAIGGCAFGEDGSLSADAGCGVTQDVAGATIIYEATIMSAKPTTLITRKPVVEVTIACTYDTASQKSAQSFINPNLEAIKGSIEGEGTYDLALNIVDSEGKPIEGAFEVEVDNPVTATVTGAGEGLKARATKCWATPAADTEDENSMYVLMEDGCPLDSTFDTSISEDGIQSFSFAAFAWTAKAGPVYLHCDLEACDVGGDCGDCQVRKRRAAMMKSYSKTNKKSMNIMKKIMVH